MITVLPANFVNFMSAADIVSYSLFHLNHTLAFASVLIIEKPGTLIACTPASPDLT